MKKFLGIIGFILLLTACNIQPAPSSDIETQADPWTFIGSPLSENAYRHTALLRGNDRPMVVRQTLVDSATSTYTFRFQEWNGTAWTTFASRTNPLVGFSAIATRSKANSTDMSIDSVGFARVTADDRISVQVYTGSSWVNIPATPIRLGKSIAYVALALDKMGLPTVAWYESTNGIDYELHVARWNGSAWQKLGNVLATDSEFSRTISLDIEIDPYNRPVVASDYYIARWNGSSWVKLGQSQIEHFPDIAFDNSNRLIVASAGSKGGSAGQLGNISVRRWTGSGWLQLGGKLDIYLDPNLRSQTSQAYIDIDSSNRPVVTWSEVLDIATPESSNVYVKSWNGSSWVLIGNKLDKVVTNFAWPPINILTTRAGKVIVGWSEAGKIYFKQR